MNLHDQVFCFTGKSPLPRNQMEAMAHKMGAKTSKTITKSTTILVTANDIGFSNKVQKAQENGIMTISPEAFFAICNEEVITSSFVQFKSKTPNKTVSKTPEKQRQTRYSTKRIIELD